MNSGKELDRVSPETNFDAGTEPAGKPERLRPCKVCKRVLPTAEMFIDDDGWWTCQECLNAPAPEPEGGAPDWLRIGPTPELRTIAAPAGEEECLPTAENVNALPEPIRQYIHDLATRCDPAGEVRELTIAKDTIRALNTKDETLILSIADLINQQVGPGKNLLTQTQITLLADSIRRLVIDLNGR